jgi:hypothetical protein
MASGHETVPHQQAEHMAASTSSANRPETLDNTEPSTHGTNQPRHVWVGNGCFCEESSRQFFESHFSPNYVQHQGRRSRR